MTDHHDDTDRRRYLEALDDLRAERDAIHPHRPVLDPSARHLHAVPVAPAPVNAPSSAGRFLTDDEIERGRRHLADLRARIAQMRAPDQKDQPA